MVVYQEVYQVVYQGVFREFENFIGYHNDWRTLLSLQLAGDQEYQMSFKVWESPAQRKFVQHPTYFQISL